MTESGYLRDMVGLGGRIGLLWLMLLETVILLLMVRDIADVDDHPGAAAGFVLMAVAGAIVVLTPTDPLPWPHTGIIVAIGPVAPLLATIDMPIMPHDHMIWTSLAYQSVLAILAVRGRILSAWIGVLAIAITAIGVAMRAGFGTNTVTAIVIPAGMVAAITVFTFIMRPTQLALQTLRTEATITAAAEATVAAQNAERDRQLTRLDNVARPMLERIASGIGLTDAERAECRLLEAELRDSLRAPQLATNSVAAAARGARARGVEVVLLDDGGLTTASIPVREVVIATAAQELDAANTGTVTIRVLPPGRRLLATVVAANRRMEVDPAGSVTRRMTPK